METEYNQVPDLNDRSKWMELEVKRESIYYGSLGNLILPIGERKYYREIKNNKSGPGICIALRLFEKEPCLIIWSHLALDKKTAIGCIALRMKNGKWAISNRIINGIPIESDGNIVHLHVYEKGAWIFLKAKKGWAIRKIKKSS